MKSCLTPVDFERSASGVLDVAAMGVVQEHLDSCPSCRAAYNEYSKKRAADGSAPDVKNTSENAETDVEPGDFPEGKAAVANNNASTMGVESLALSRQLETVADSRPPGQASKHFPEIEGYEIVSVLGQGGMGIVYRAMQTKLNRIVALKVLPAVMGSASSAAVLRFRAEATAAARLHHTNIVPVYDYGESRDSYYYAMELIVGKPMDEIIQQLALKSVAAVSLRDLGTLVREFLVDQTEPATPAQVDPSPDTNVKATIAPLAVGHGRPYYLQVARWMADAADALHYAHSQGIIHRDIKPANLILSVDHRIMLADFGLAKLAGEQSITMTGTLVGTLRYMSPEQAMAGHLEVDHRTDIYSLGAFLYELLCFQPAVAGSDEKQILSAIISREPTSPRRLVKTVPHELDTICLRALEKSPDARYRTAKDLSDDLRRFINDLPIAAKPPGPITRAVKFARRHKALVIAVSAVVLLLAAGTYSVRQRTWRREAEIASRAAEVKSLYESGKRQHSNTVNNPEKKIWKAAEDAFREALKIDPDHESTLIAWATMKKDYFNSAFGGDKEVLRDADELYRRARELSPEGREALNPHGVVLKMLGQYDDAIAAYRESLAKIPEKGRGGTHHYSTVSNLGTVYALAKDLRNAEDLLRKGAEIAGVSANIYRTPSWRNLAALELFLGQSQALEDVNHALDCNASDVASWILKARIELELGEESLVEEALDDVKHADRSRNGKRADAKRIRALAHLRFHQYNHAITQANLAMQLGDLKSIDHLIIAIAQANLNHPTKARDSVVAAEATWPDDLREPGAYRANAKSGELWFDTHDELHRLRKEAVDLLETPTLSP
ncbi:MAG: protein kinase [Planctomycetes bacterium]|nr:protein kinase [Planctomycetota bacterium]